MLLILGAALSSCSVGRAAMIGRTSLAHVFFGRMGEVTGSRVIDVSGLQERALRADQWSRINELGFGMCASGPSPKPVIL